ncbi:hypothetical protein GA0074692_0536 [Micromonospora pallida]|uniref:Uncharacterized protein n=1 Tax=Micromonospora pallida TaxID=145854 RepID=A0A1C6RPR4_9ACTN|nr:hypothetical protein [Micromonospora pallida]SCL19057.1 hypothetical protein GA0074692_0536 [Micromonospora pallida]
MRSVRLRAALAVARCAARMLPDPRQRARYLEQWQADVHGAAELGLPALRLALGTAGAAARIIATSPKGSTMMLPVGPLALGMRIVGGARGRRRAAVLAILLTLTLLGGVTLLIAG